MNRIKELDPQRPELEKWIKSVAAGLDRSAMSISVFTKDYAKGIDSLLQFAVAVMMDKPIYLLVEEGTPTPNHVKRIASGIEFYKAGDVDSATAATRRLIQQAQTKTLSS